MDCNGSTGCGDRAAKESAPLSARIESLSKHHGIPIVSESTRKPVPDFAALERNGARETGSGQTYVIDRRWYLPPAGGLSAAVPRAGRPRR